MIFNEIYGSYYSAVASILNMAIQGKLNENSMKEIIEEKAFSESYIEISSALKNGKWKLISSDYKTPIKHVPSLPLSTLQLMWLKAISLDKRMKLFDVNFDFLKDVEPLFLPEDYIIFDKYNDGDPFENEKYIKVFRTILSAIKEHKEIKTEYLSMKGNKRTFVGTPIDLEYSEKDDRFRVNIIQDGEVNILNLAGIENCEIIGESQCDKLISSDHSEIYFVAELVDERNTLERFLLHFAHFKKEAVRISNNKYRVTVYYDRIDQTELVIRILSFGLFVRVQEPQRFINLIKERLILQKSCGLK